MATTTLSTFDTMPIDEIDAAKLVKRSKLNFLIFVAITHKTLSNIYWRFLMPKSIAHITLILVASTISIAMISCGSSKTTECNSIAKVLEKVQAATKEMDAAKTTDPDKAATVFSDMSGKIEGFGKDIKALKIEDEKLKGYQLRISEMYAGYGRLFGQMAPAIKSRNASEVSKDVAELKASSVKEQALGKEIGAYCGGN